MLKIITQVPHTDCTYDLRLIYSQVSATFVTMMNNEIDKLADFDQSTDTLPSVDHKQ